MGRSLRSSKNKQNNTVLRNKVFGPIEAARTERLSQRTQAIAASSVVAPMEVDENEETAHKSAEEALAASSKTTQGTRQPLAPFSGDRLNKRGSSEEMQEMETERKKRRPVIPAEQWDDQARLLGPSNAWTRRYPVFSPNAATVAMRCSLALSRNTYMFKLEDGLPEMDEEHVEWNSTLLHAVSFHGLDDDFLADLASEFPRGRGYSKSHILVLDHVNWYACAASTDMEVDGDVAPTTAKSSKKKLARKDSRKIRKDKLRKPRNMIAFKARTLDKNRRRREPRIWWAKHNKEQCLWWAFGQ
jgi:hypothetical protein